MTPIRKYAVQARSGATSSFGLGCMVGGGLLVAIAIVVALMLHQRPLYTARLVPDGEGNAVLWYRFDHLPRADGLAYGREQISRQGIPVDIIDKELVGNHWRYLCRTQDGRGGWAEYYQLEDVRGAE